MDFTKYEDKEFINQLQHVNDDLKSVNVELCNKDFDNFLKLHNKEVERLKNIELSKALRNVI